MPNKMFICMFF